MSVAIKIIWRAWWNSWASSLEIPQWQMLTTTTTFVALSAGQRPGNLSQPSSNQEEDLREHPSPGSEMSSNGSGAGDSTPTTPMFKDQYSPLWDLQRNASSLGKESNSAQDAAWPAENRLDFSTLPPPRNLHAVSSLHNCVRCNPMHCSGQPGPRLYSVLRRAFNPNPASTRLRAWDAVTGLVWSAVSLEAECRAFPNLGSNLLGLASSSTAPHFLLHTPARLKHFCLKKASLCWYLWLCCGALFPAWKAPPDACVFCQLFHIRQGPVQGSVFLWLSLPWLPGGRLVTTAPWTHTAP